MGQVLFSTAFKSDVAWEAATHAVGILSVFVNIAPKIYSVVKNYLFIPQESGVSLADYLWTKLSPYFPSDTAPAAIAEAIQEAVPAASAAVEQNSKSLLLLAVIALTLVLYKRKIERITHTEIDFSDPKSRGQQVIIKPGHSNIYTSIHLGANPTSQIASQKGQSSAGQKALTSSSSISPPLVGTLLPGLPIPVLGAMLKTESTEQIRDTYKIRVGPGDEERELALQDGSKVWIIGKDQTLPSTVGRLVNSALGLLKTGSSVPKNQQGWQSNQAPLSDSFDTDDAYDPSSEGTYYPLPQESRDPYPLPPGFRDYQDYA
jgi:hypothetical protein